MKKKRSFIILLVAMLMTSLAVGCGEKEKPKKEKDENSKELSKADFLKLSGKDLMKRYVKDENGKATVEEYMIFLENAKYMDFDKGELEWSDGAVEFNININKADGKNFASKEVQEEMVKQYKDSEIPQLRWLYIDALDEYYFENPEEKIAIYKEYMKNETEGPVIARLLTAMRDVEIDDEILSYYQEKAQAEEPYIREASANIGYNTNEKVPGSADIIITLLQDPDEAVRRKAASFAKDIQDESVVPYVAQILNNPDESEMNHVVAGAALGYIWTGFPSYKLSSAEAYEEYIAYLKNIPREDSVPEFTIIESATAPDGFEEDMLAFLANTDYYNAEELVTICTEILQDDLTGYNTKRACVTVISQHGSLEQLEAVRPYIESWDSISQEDLINYLNEEVAKK